MLKYFFVRDAKMALVSHLLKHHVISSTLGVSWAATRLTRDARGKPIYVDPASGTQPCAFNVSHQAGLVALVAVVGYDGPGPVDVGVDIVCVSERRDRDRRLIRDEGWARFVEVHSDVFGRGEDTYLKRGGELQLPLYSSGGGGGGSRPRPPAGSAQEETVKLRCFYALWCLREAYVKMTGDALLAPWLGDLEFVRFRAPAAVEASGLVAGRNGTDEVLTEHEVVFKGQTVDDANIALRSLGRDYMTCAAFRTPEQKETGLGWGSNPFEMVDIETVISHAEAAGGL